MINQVFLDKDYYIKRLTLFMQESFGVIEQFDNLVEIHKALEETLDTMFEKLDILNQTDLSDALYTDFLDKIASIYSISRKLTVTLSGTNYSLTLDNNDLLKYIKMRIIQNNFVGTYKECEDLFSNIVGMQIRQVTGGNGQCDVYLISYDSDIYSINIKRMFLAGLFCLKSIGITYTFHSNDPSTIGIWDDSTKTWDSSSCLWN